MQLLSLLRGVFRGKPKFEKFVKTRRVYGRPTARKLAQEQAKLNIIGHAVVGKQGAKDLMELLFQGSVSKTSDSERRSA